MEIDYCWVNKVTHCIRMTVKRRRRRRRRRVDWTDVYQRIELPPSRFEFHALKANPQTNSTYFSLSLSLSFFDEHRLCCAVWNMKQPSTRLDSNPTLFDLFRPVQFESTPPVRIFSRTSVGFFLCVLSIVPNLLPPIPPQQGNFNNFGRN